MEQTLKKRTIATTAFGHCHAEVLHSGKKLRLIK